MKRKRAVHSPTTKPRRRRRSTKLTQLEEQLSLLLVLLQHNIDKILKLHRTR